MSIAALLMVALGVVGWASGSDAAKETGFFLFALFGFGAAWLILLRRSEWSALAMSAPVGLAFVILTGFTLVEIREWGLATPVFIVATIGASCVHVAAVVRARPIGWPSSRTAATNGSQSHAEDGRDAERRGKVLRFGVLALAVIGLGASMVSADALGNFDPSRPSGILGALSPAWYVGFALIIVAVGAGFLIREPVSSPTLSKAAVALPVIALVLAVTLTPALAYTEPRYSWTAKHLGVTLYILRHGSVDPKIDIYQAWPGLFAGVAWISRAVGLHDPLAVARWWPPVIDLATVLVFQQLALRALSDRRRSWIAAAILVVGNSIGQDYFSPQAAAYLLAIAVFAILYRRPGEAKGLGASEWAVLVALAVAIAVTHQLTPYMVIAATVVLLVFGLLRSTFVPVAVLIAAVGWALLHISVVSHYFSFGQLGHVGSNVLTKGLANPGIHKSTLIHYDSYALAADAFLIGLIAIVTLLRRRTRSHLAFAVCAASGGGLFLANSYGNEGIFRVVLFALPWLAILGADWDPIRASVRNWVPVAMLPVLLGLYLFSDMGLDYINAVRVGDLQALRTFERTAPAGAELITLGKGYTPIRSTGRYNLFTFRFYPYVVPPAAGSAPGSRSFVAYKQFLNHYLDYGSKGLRKHADYVLAAQQPAADLRELDLASIAQYAALSARFADSNQWVVVQRTKTATLYVLKSFFYAKAHPDITGTFTRGQVLTTSTGNWPSLNPLKFAFQWKSCSTHCRAIPGATHRTYRLEPADVGKRIKIVVTATDSTGRSRTGTFEPRTVVARSS